MTKLRVVGIREETAVERAKREWFEQQVVASPANLHEAARLLIGLVTGLLTVLFGVLAISKEPLPAFLHLPAIRALGILTVGSLLVGLLAALIVVLPQRWTANPARPDTQAKAFERILQFKARALSIATVAFGLGILLLGVVLVTALWVTA